MATVINVKELIGSENCYEREEGKILLLEMVDKINTHKKVKVDFSGVKVVTSGFLSTSFGDLLTCRPILSLIKNSIEIINLDNYSRHVLNGVMKSKVERLVNDNPCRSCPYLDCTHHPA